MKKGERGITLIALVITIIVLLILAGVTIATLTGDNGILTRANEAKVETEEAKEDELRKLTALEAATNIENQPYTDKNGDTATIPAGFAVSQVEDENTIEDGLVIIDSKGNEFVWVPVNYDKEKNNFDDIFVRKSGYSKEVIQEMDHFGEVNSKGFNVDVNNTNTGITESIITQEEATQMYSSVKENGGFYIGRYESGKDANENLVIQKQVNAYTDIAWSKNQTMNEETPTTNTKDGAIELSRNFANINNYETVTSTLCYGVQWDATLTWIDPEYINFVKNSTENGWYNNNYNQGNPNHQTGIDLNGGNNKKKNIYDLAGNVWEWTMESYYAINRVYRGRRL